MFSSFRWVVRYREFILNLLVYFLLTCILEKIFYFQQRKIYHKTNIFFVKPLSGQTAAIRLIFLVKLTQQININRQFFKLGH